MERKPSTLIICIILLLLLLSVAALSQLNRSEGELVAGQLEIVAQGQLQANLTLEQIYDLPAVEVYKNIVSSGQENQAGSFSGVYLSELLDAAAPGWQQGASQVICRAEDNYVSGFDLDEVLDTQNILVAYALDGELLSGMEEGGKGPLRLVVLGDEFGTRSTYWLCRIEVE